MKLIVTFVVCWVAMTLEATASDTIKGIDKPFQPRYTLVADSKKKDLEVDLERHSIGTAGNEKQPWQRLAYAGYGGLQTGWPSSAPLISLGQLLAPGLLLLGVNLGALLYMILGLLGLAPPHRINGWQGADIYRKDREHVGDAGKEMTMYF